MCGRYAASRDPADLVEEFEVDQAPAEALAPDYNVAPTKKVYVVLARESDDGGVRRELDVARWGLVPSWAKDPSIGSRLINARMETVAEKPSFRRAFARRRCLVPADGYYEWYTPTDPDAPRGRGGKPVKQPFFIHPTDGHPMAMAGLYEWWRDPTRDEDHPAAWLLSMTLLTTTAEDGLGRIHDRMPLLVPRERWVRWLDPAVDGRADGATDLLVPAAPGLLAAYPVSTAVNSVRNNGPELLTPLPPDGLPPDVLPDEATP
jgi:putative SOS response-associated peptidase YedK